MSVLNQIACLQGRRDEVPNQELARRLVESDDRAGIQEIAANLFNPKTDIQSDCIKVLYEVGYLQPALITAYAPDFLKLLRSRQNRLVWGAMLALATISRLAAADLYPHIAQIQKAMESGSVITVDGGVATLAGIASADAQYGAAISPYLIQHLRTCRPKDVAQHAEKTLPAITAANRADFIAALEQRLEDLSPAQAARVKRVIKRAADLSRGGPPGPAPPRGGWPGS